ncbi:hypothetical protein A0H81_13082 [Grifola frondosa]|uniref:Uncharacterized protein n=1 Tax=Grifola frondosa TaxID=5627 RepID=A0A1C7LS11_GRIFR|nr:hypothetical protein A0H81_13082 [Grifola frondosa]
MATVIVFLGRRDVGKRAYSPDGVTTIRRCSSSREKVVPWCREKTQARQQICRRIPELTLGQVGERPFFELGDPAIGSALSHFFVGGFDKFPCQHAQECPMDKIIVLHRIYPA